MATLEQLSAALIKADAAGNTADAKAFADAIRQMQTAPAASPVAAPLRGKAGMFDMLSAPFEMGMELANKPRAEQAAFIAPTVEALGAGGGAMLGSMGGPLGTVTGAGAGYAGAKELMRHVAGTATPETLPQASQRVAENAITGAALEAGGRGIIGPVIDKAAKAAGWVFDTVSGNLLQVRAGKIIRQIAGADLDAVKAAASNAPQNLTAAQAVAPVGNDMLSALGARAAKNDVVNFFSRTAAEQEAARSAALKAVTPDITTAQAMRGNAASPLYTAATQPSVAINTKPLVTRVDDLLARNPGNPELVTALNKIKTGLESSNNAEQVSSVLDGLKTAIASKDNKFIAKNLLDVKSSIESALPGYKTAQQVFATASKPVNQAAVLGEMQNVLAREGGGERVTPFLNVLGRGENALLKRSTGEARFGGLEDVLSKPQMAVVDNVAGQLTRDLQLVKAATRGEGGLSRILGENKAAAELPPAFNLYTRTTNKVLSLLEGRVNTNTLKAMENGMRSGKDLMSLINKLPAAERVNALKAIGTSAKDFGRAATFGTNALIPESENQNALVK
jgi:hypothetical protein